ncbi:hypothetical protein M3E13_07420 [Oceanobacillus kimchii]|uniref:hypothetical protein n=1 Tax=Oceanobacillus kimchii TaxID=746691 RepID=UPI00034AD9D0|nr:hypothetical protein [Oceanobacillus kimchii]MCT1576104.1 hypothetical protein [Oceanobacillus kimchii]MCT2135741.1 hypothetical protein [Oceanobacillus kimchii]
MLEKIVLRDESVLHFPRGCNKAPRKESLVQFYANILESRSSNLNQFVSPSITWKEIHNTFIEGAEIINVWLIERHKDIEEMYIESVITHGKEAAVKGTYTSNNELTYFCDIFEFKSAGRQAPIIEVTSFRMNE